MTTYSDKLKNPKWQKKRLEILERDEFTCQRCYDTESTLVVHHHWYYKGKDPWQYQDECFITWCESCHKSHHDNEYQAYKELTFSMKQCGFHSEDVDKIREGFTKVFLKPDSNVASRVVEYFLSTEEVFIQVRELYFEYISDELARKRRA